MRVNPGFAAAGARKNQKRPFRGGNRFPLLRVQSFEEIHDEGTL
jgi:hypothetical protein